MISDLNKTIGGSTDLAKKRHGSADLHTPIHPLRKEIRKLTFRALALRRSDLYPRTDYLVVPRSSNLFNQQNFFKTAQQPI